MDYEWSKMGNSSLFLIINKWQIMDMWRSSLQILIENSNNVCVCMKLTFKLAPKNKLWCEEAQDPE